MANATRRRFESNYGLARARAEAVKERLTKCTPSIGADALLALVAGPGTTPATPNADRSGFGADRRVDVWALWGSARVRKASPEPSQDRR